MTDDIAARALTTSRLIHAPRERVFAGLSDPVVLARWWGPAGFTNTFHEFDFRPGGYWRFIMHGPDGRNYPNESRFEEIVVPERVVFRHFSGHFFEMTITLHDEGGKTRLDWCQAFDTVEDCERIRSIAEPANEQNLDRLEAVLASG